MATKKAEHVVMGNNCFQCLNCGRKQDLPMPIDVGMFGAMSKEFTKQHKDCAKTWERPVSDGSGKTEEENADWWLTNGERGVSSETMFRYLSGKRVGKHECHPYDPDDFRRCYLLLQAVPQWKEKLHLLKPVSKVWSNLVDNWGKLEEMLLDNMKNGANGMYEFMKSLGC